MKKVLSLLLVFVLALGMSTIAFAANPKVNKDVNVQPDEWYTNAPVSAGVVTGNVINSDDIDLGEFNPGNSQGEIKIKLPQANFAPADAANPLVGTPSTSGGTQILTKKEIKDSKIVAKFKASKGGQVIDEVKIDGDIVKVKFVNPFKSNNTDGVDFEIRVYLVVDGKNWSAHELTFTGTYVNPVDEDADADTDYFDFSDGMILKPSEFIRAFDGDLGEGVIVNMRGLKNAKYWGVANTDLNDADQELLVKYASIDQVYHIQQIGIAPVANFVTLEEADPTAYVYDGDLKYLGRGNAHLPLTETYYLAAAELDVDDEEIEPEIEDEIEDEIDDGGDEDYIPGGNVDGGGDDLYPANPHDNPGTGK